MKREEADDGLYNAEMRKDSLFSERVFSLMLIREGPFKLYPNLLNIITLTRIQNRKNESRYTGSIFSGNINFSQKLAYVIL